MPSTPGSPNSQLTLNFEMSLPERFGSLREYIAHRIQVQARPAKTIAGDMDLSPSTLSRKLAPGDGDTQRFNTDDLETYIKVTKDTSAIEYLAAKYLCSDTARTASVLARMESMCAEVMGMAATLKDASK